MITFLKEVLKINKIFKTIKRLVSTRTGATSRQAIKVVAGFKPAPAKKVDNQKTPLSHNLDANLSGVRQALGSASDLVIRRFNIGGAKGQQAALIFLDGFVDVNRIGDQILRPVSERVDAVTVSQLNPGQLLRHLQQDILPVADIKHYGMLEKVLEQVLGGYTALFCDGANMALAMDTIAFEHRDVAEPTQETVIRGPKEGLNENIQNNIIMIRRKITHPQLRFDKITIGRYSQTQVIVVYINDVAEASLVQEVKDRLSRVDIDGVIESGCLEQLIEDTPYSLFPTIGNTEKPDTVVARILEGKVAVLVDGTPVALTMPRLFYETIQTTEDYYSRHYSASMARVLRYTLLVITTILPALYLAIVNYHPEIIPTPFAITIAAAQEGVPLPLFLEILIMGFFFEGLREAGVRLPRPVGPAVTIVGALVIGEAAVMAGIVGAPSVVVTALVGIAGFASPGLGDVFPLLRVFLLGLSGMLGFYGLLIGLLLCYAHMCSLRSFGETYMIPVAPLQLSAWKDIFVRAPLWALDKRPGFITRRNRTRMGPSARPGPPPLKTKPEKQ